VVQGPAEAYATLRRASLSKPPDIKLPDTINVTDLMDYVPFSPKLDIEDATFSYLMPEFAEGVISLPSPTTIVPGIRGTQEDVSMIYGTALGLYVEYFLKGTCRFVKVASMTNVTALQGDFLDIGLWLSRPLAEIMNGWSNVMRTATAILCVGNQLTHYWRQIGDYDTWVEVDRMNGYCQNVLAQLYGLTGATSQEELSKRVKFEHKLNYAVAKGCTLRGYADMVVDDTHVVELKVTKEDANLNFALQVLAYTAIHQYESGKMWIPHVLHAPSGQMFPIQYHVPLAEILELLVNRKVSTILSHK
jgi:hypothetical protein